MSNVKSKKEGQTSNVHSPVLLHEVLEILDPKPGEFIIDGTVNGGGHAEEIVKKIAPNGMLLGLDWDDEMLACSRKRLEGKGNVVLAQGNYAELPEILEGLKMERADGLLLDLGFSSNQLENSGRGFSFSKNEVLDMRYNQSESEMATEVLNRAKEAELADIFYTLGEERAARRIAKEIVETRKKKPIITTHDLVALAKKHVKGSPRLNPATKLFQALRIYVNRELENIETVIEVLPKIVKPGGRVVIISFHSLEDRIVKNKFKELEKNNRAAILTKKPKEATKEEQAQNPRSRSAKLRALSIK